jgi:hypothetical protein
MTEREEWVAKNEATSREMNEKIEQSQSKSSDYFRIVCECGQRDCPRVIAISVPEYEAVRSDARDFAVVKAHVMLDVEQVVRETDRFSVVRKHEGFPAEVAKARDMRS